MMASHTGKFLIRLHRWAHRQDENFTTEAFVHLIKTLLDLEYQSGIDFLSKLTNGFLQLCRNQHHAEI